MTDLGPTASYGGFEIYLLTLKKSPNVAFRSWSRFNNPFRCIQTTRHLHRYPPRLHENVELQTFQIYFLHSCSFIFETTREIQINGREFAVGMPQIRVKLSWSKLSNLTFLNTLCLLTSRHQTHESFYVGRLYLSAYLWQFFYIHCFLLNHF